MQDPFSVPTLVEGLTGVERKPVIFFVQEPMVANAQDSASPSRFLFAGAREPGSADCSIRQVDPIVRNRQRGISVASFTVGDDYLIDGPEEFFADAINRASHFVFVVRVSDDEQNSNRFSRQRF
jgi:hypothetical protein